MNNKKTIIIGASISGAVLLVVMIVLIVIATGGSKSKPVQEEVEEYDIVVEEEEEEITEVTHQYVEEIPEKLVETNALFGINKASSFVERDFVQISKHAVKYDSQFIFCYITAEYEGFEQEVQIGYNIYYELPDDGIIIADIEHAVIGGVDYIVGIVPVENYKELLKGIDNK